MTPIPLVPGSTPLAALEAVYRTAAPVAVDPAARAAVDAAVAVVARAAAGDAAVYGVNTGFGKLASLRIPPADTAQLQKNLVRSHASGVGPALPTPVVRLVMALKILSLGRGASGVRWAVIELLEGLINHGITPIIPAQGSVGASGDLAPLAHLSLVLIGEGEAEVAGRVVPGAEALASAGLAPVTLGAKEGLGLINGTQVSTALALAGVFDGWRLAVTSLLSASLTTDAAMGSTAPLRPELHALRGHRGQIDAAAAMERILSGSEIRESHRFDDERVQDPYCIRCQPQVAGAAMELLRTQAAMLETEANAVTDNPLVIGNDIVSGGNFHAEPVAFAADIVALAVAEIGSIAQRRVALIVDPTLSYGLPPFLTPKPGLNSGFMIAEVTAAALMSENKQRAAPASIDSTPTSASQEDHVSMACHAARRLGDMNANLSRILAIELLAAAQGVRFRAPLRTSPALAGLLAALEALSPPLEEDRSLSPDIERVAAAVEAGTLIDALPPGTLPALA